LLSARVVDLEQVSGCAAEPRGGSVSLARPHAISHDVLAAGALPGRGAPAGARGEPEVSRRRDSNPEPPDYKEGAIRLIWPLPATMVTPPAPAGACHPMG
jgi:hypothetical protein